MAEAMQGASEPATFAGCVYLVDAVEAASPVKRLRGPGPHRAAED